MKHPFVLAGSVVWVLAAIPPALAAEAQPPVVAPNVRITFEIRHGAGGGNGATSSYRLVTADGAMAKLSNGNRLPLPTVAGGGETKEGKESTISSFTYQSVGLEATVTARLVERGQIRLTGDLQASVVQRAESPAATPWPPVVATISQHLDVVLQSGVPLVIASVEEPGAGTIELKVRAEVLSPK